MIIALEQMNPSQPRLPRCHMQRQALRSARNAASRCDLQSQEHPQAREPHIERHNILDSHLDIDSVSDLEQDSGYSSYSNLEAEVRFYN
jgi:hypothetical protein